MNNSRDSRLGVIGLMSATAVLTSLLHWLGNVAAYKVDWSNPLVWLNQAAPEDAIAALLRYAGLALGYWILAGTALYVALAVRNDTSRPSWAGLLTLPTIRRMVDRALATSLVLSIAVSPVGSLQAVDSATGPPPVVHELADDGIPVPHVRMASVTENSDDEPAPPVEDATETAPEVAPTEADRDVVAPVSLPAAAVPAPLATSRATAAVATAESTTYRVEPGDNLWSISARHVETVAGATPDTAEIAGYWRNLITSNETTLRSGDPNLIYPGEIITMPPMEVSS